MLTFCIVFACESLKFVLPKTLSLVSYEFDKRRRRRREKNKYTNKSLFFVSISNLNPFFYIFFSTSYVFLLFLFSFFVLQNANCNEKKNSKVSWLLRLLRPISSLFFFLFLYIWRQLNVQIGASKSSLHFHRKLSIVRLWLPFCFCLPLLETSEN